METETLPYFPEPRNDNERLMNFQREYRTGNPAALDGMYKLLFTIAHKTINKRCMSSKKLRELTTDDREQRAHDAATWVIEQYIKRPDFVVNDSITGYMFRYLPHVLYGEAEKKCNRMLVFTDQLPEKNGARTAYKYIAHNDKTGESVTYESAAELYLNPAFARLRKKRLAESIRTGKPWKNYRFEILEVNA